MIQRVIETEFADTTILCIAHRISTLTWMDQIVVMEDGKVVETRTPRELLMLVGRGIEETKIWKLARANREAYLEEMIRKARVGGR